jgi:hypothetical protein
MRVFVPATVDDLRHLHDEARLAAPLEAFGATPQLRAELGDLGEEETEYALTTAAAESSYDVLRFKGDRVGRRVVLVADVEDSAVETHGDTPGVVRVSADVVIAQVAAVLVDPSELELAALPDVDLAWYATQEIPGLLA